MSLLKTFKDKLGNIIYPATHAKAVFVEKNGTAVDLQTAIDNGDIGGGGHTILDNSGTEMIQRGKLQFSGASVTDNSANDRTVVTISGGVPATTLAPAYSSSKSYVADEFFTYNNTVYKVKVACVGVTPPNTTYYEVTTVMSQINVIPINPTSAQISAFSNGAMWITT